MKKSYRWIDHALQQIQRISEMTLLSPLGLHCEPDEYLDILDDYTKLLFDKNKIPDQFCDDLEKLDNQFILFKHLLIDYCKKICLEIENIEETECEN